MSFKIIQSHFFKSESSYVSRNETHTQNENEQLFVQYTRVRIDAVRNRNAISLRSNLSTSTINYSSNLR